MKVLAKKTNKNYEVAEMNHDFFVQVQNETGLVVRPVGLPKSWECFDKYVIPAELLEGEYVVNYSVGESTTSAVQAFENAFDTVIKDYMQFITEENKETVTENAPENKKTEAAAEKEKPKRGRKKKVVEEVKEEVVENVINEENVSAYENEPVADTSAEMENISVNNEALVVETVEETPVAEAQISIPEVPSTWVSFNQDAITVEQEIRAAAETNTAQPITQPIPEPAMTPMDFAQAMPAPAPFISEPVSESMIAPAFMENVSHAPNPLVVATKPDTQENLITPVMPQMPLYTPVPQPMYASVNTNVEQPIVTEPIMNPVVAEQPMYTNPVVTQQPAPMPVPTPVPVAVPAPAPVASNPVPTPAPTLSTPAQPTFSNDIWNQEITFGPLAHQETPVTIATAPIEGLQWYINNIKETSRFYYLRQAIEAYLAQTQGV